jgi:hypothetical protein
MDAHAEGASDVALWLEVLRHERRYITARAAFLTGAQDRVGILSQALHTPSQRGTALRVVPLLDEPVRRALFDDLVRLASVGHADVTLCRDAIRSLPREWVLAHIEASAEPLLLAGDEEEYRRLLELYEQLDADLTRRLATRAARDDRADVREAGNDFLERLSPP